MEQKVFTLVLAILCCWTILPSLAAHGAEPTAEELLQAGIDDYNALRYEAAIDKLERAAADRESNPSLRVEIHRYLAFANVALNKKSQAQAEFEKALAIDPTFRVDPLARSPKILEVFDRAREQFRMRLAKSDGEAPVITHEGFKETVPFGRQVAVEATIRDRTEIAETQLFYRKAGDYVYAYAPLIRQGAEHYLGVIPAEAATAESVEYYLIAIDMAGNAALIGNTERPLTIAVDPEPVPRPWYKRRMVWAAALGFAGTAAAIIAVAGREDGGGSRRTGGLSFIF